jgi:hypothetical protein
MAGFREREKRCVCRPPERYNLDLHRTRTIGTIKRPQEDYPKSGVMRTMVGGASLSDMNCSGRGHSERRLDVLTLDFRHQKPPRACVG